MLPADEVCREGGAGPGVAGAPGTHPERETTPVLAPESLDELMTATDAATATGIPAGTIRTWAHRGYLPPDGLDSRDRPMYRLGNVLRCERDRRQNALGARSRG